MKKELKYKDHDNCYDIVIAIVVLLPLLPLSILMCLVIYASRKISYWVYWCYDSITDKMTEDE